MGIFSGIRCDQCGEVGELNAAQEPPDGWIKLEICGVVGSRQVVCKISCAQKWITNRKKEASRTGRKKEEQNQAFCDAHCSLDGEHPTHHEDCPLAPSWA